MIPVERARMAALCDRIAIEKDPEIFTDLVEQLSKLLETKESRLRSDSNPRTNIAPEIPTRNALPCPYCTDDSVSRSMTARADGEWFICARCGHAAMPTQPSYRCNCENCTASRPGPSSHD